MAQKKGQMVTEGLLWEVGDCLGVVVSQKSSLTDGEREEGEVNSQGNISSLKFETSLGYRVEPHVSKSTNNSSNDNKPLTGESVLEKEYLECDKKINTVWGK